jgi:hypothetical protein
MELVRHASTSVAHELGGIAIALDLRAGVISGTVSAQDFAAPVGAGRLTFSVDMCVETGLRVPSRDACL